MQIGAGCATPAARAKLSQKTSWNGIGTCAEAQNFKMLLPNRCFDDIRNIEISKYRNIEISKYRNIEVIGDFEMKRLHLHVNVPNIGQAISFYSTLFDAPPVVVKDDYAKWMLDDPSVNLAISTRTRATGIDHVGIQVDSPVELSDLATRLKAAGNKTFDQEATTCCYAKSDKSWVTYTAGVRWETFYTMGQATSYGEDEVLPDVSSACCDSTAASG